MCKLVRGQVGRLFPLDKKNAFIILAQQIFRAIEVGGTPLSQAMFKFFNREVPQNLTHNFFLKFKKIFLYYVMLNTLRTVS